MKSILSLIIGFLAAAPLASSFQPLSDRSVLGWSVSSHRQGRASVRPIVLWAGAEGKDDAEDEDIPFISQMPADSGSAPEAQESTKWVDPLASSNTGLALSPWAAVLLVWPIILLIDDVLHFLPSGDFWDVIKFS